MRVTLRPYQAEALDRVAAAEARGVRRQLLVAATGLGKTVMFSALAERRGGRTLILAHRDELVAQAAAKVSEVWPDASVGVVKAERDEVHADVVVASVQTLARPARLERLCATYEDRRLLLGAAAPFGLVVVDEAHHAAAETYGRIISRLRAGDPDGPLLLGVTATPDRGDGQGLDGMFDEVVATYDILWGIRSGYLADLRGIAVTLDGLDLSSVKVSRGDFQAGDAGRALQDAAAPQAVVRAWQEHAAGRKTLVFTPTVALADEVAATFHAAGVPAAWVSGDTPLEDRRRILAAFAAGRLTVVANCAVLTEGFDEPSVSCVVIARPTKSRGLYTQMVGRGTRRHPDKDDCLVLDVVGASAEHSLVTVPSLFGLPDAVARKSEGRSMSEVVAEHEAEQVRLGRLRAEEVDLFRTVRRAGLAWVATHHTGAEQRRYVLGLGRNPDGTDAGRVVLFHVEHDRADGWAAQVQTDDGVRTLVRSVTLEMAQGVAEDFVRSHAPSLRLVDADAEWRRRKPTPRQQAAAKKWRLPDAAQYQTAGDLSDALTAHIERVKSRRARRA